MTAVKIARSDRPGMQRGRHGNALTAGLPLLPLVAGTMVFLLIDGLYLLLVEILQRFDANPRQDAAYQYVFAAHLIVGVLFAVFLVLFLALHFRRMRARENPRAKRRGYLLASIGLLLVASGFLLLEVPGVRGVLNDWNRVLVYLLHVVLPFAVVPAYVLHRKAASRPLQRGISRVLLASTIAGLVAIVPIYLLPTVQPAGASKVPKTVFEPSLLKVSETVSMTAEDLMRDDYCGGCHQDIHDRWDASAHRHSSFSNPFYAASVKKTRDAVLARDGNLRASRFCAGCHDPIPLITGEFDRPDFGLANFRTASAGLTCTVCHAVTSIDSPRGNADFTIASPQHYPFAFSDNSYLRWFSNLLLRSNPDFHKRSFLKPLHKSAEFCGSCHKVHIPEELNDYRWLRGQNHYDSFLQSGISGHRVDSFYYPPAAEPNCNGCHMPDLESFDPAAERRSSDGALTVADHLFPGGNTALPFTLADEPGQWLAEHETFLRDAVTLDVIGFRAGGRVDGEFIPAHRFPAEAEPGQTYLLELVVRTRTVGHAFTQGTTDSNQVWVELQQRHDERTVAASGGLDDLGRLDENGTFLVRNYVVDRLGRRIARRNVEDIHSVVYSRQIPPGAADVVHYRFTLPEEGIAAVTFEARLLYRKFDSEFRQFSLPGSSVVNDLPVLTISTARFAMSTNAESLESPAISISDRLNDYGIALYRKPGRAQFRQAEQVFRGLSDNGYPAGGLNLVRLLLDEGRVDEATEALEEIPLEALDNPWTAVWLGVQIDLQNGFITEAIEGIRRLASKPPGRALASNFDFSRDYEVLDTLGEALLTSSRSTRFDAEERKQLLHEAQATYERLLRLDPERASAHQGLMRVATLQGRTAEAERHRRLHEKYKPDEYARARTATNARELNPSLDRQASDVVIYDLEKLH